MALRGGALARGVVRRRDPRRGGGGRGRARRAGGGRGGGRRASSTTAPRPWWPPRARRSRTPPSSLPTPARSRSTPRPRTAAWRCSCATAAPASTPTAIPADRRASASRSWGGWSATAAPRRIDSAPGEGTEVELMLDREPGMSARASRPSSSSTTTRSSARACAPSSRASSTSSPTSARSRRRSARSPSCKPDVVLLDVHMPGGGGVEVIRKVAETMPAQRFLALSVSDAAEDVIAVVRAGARGYVTKSISGPELADAVRRVRDGDAVFSPRLAGLRPRRLRRPDPRGADRPRARPAHDARARGPATDRTRLPLQGGRAASSRSRPRPWRPTSRRSCESSSSPTATSSAAGRSERRLVD